MRGAGALGRHHARADRILGRTYGAEQLAVLRPLDAAQDRAALAGLVVGDRPVAQRKTPLGVERGQNKLYRDGGLIYPLPMR